MFSDDFLNHNIPSRKEQEAPETQRAKKHYTRLLLKVTEAEKQLLWEDAGKLSCPGISSAAH